MIKKQNNGKAIDFALITIGLDNTVSEQLLGCFKKTPWPVTLHQLDSYVSAVRRPSLSTDSRTTAIRVAVVDFDKNPDKAVEAAQYLATAFVDKITVIALGKENNSATLLNAMRAGCTEFLYRPFDEKAVAQLVNRLVSVSSTPSPLDSTAGLLLSFFGVKGGVGTTTLATHLAMYLARDMQKRTLLIDNHAQLGHVCAYLGMPPTGYYFSDLVRNVSRLDSELLKGFVARHSDGLDVLSSPDNYSQIPEVDAVARVRTLEFLRAEYDYVVLDSELSFDETSIGIMKMSSQVYFVANPTFACVRDLARSMDRFAENEWAVDRLEVIINRMSKNAALDQKQIEKAIKAQVARCIPEEDSALMRAVNLGQTVSPKSKLEFSDRLTEWAVSLARRDQDDPAASAKKDSRFFSSWHKSLLY